MSVIDIDHGVVPFGQLHDVLHRCDVSVHTKESVCDNEGGFATGRRAKQSLKMMHVTMVVDAKHGSAEAAAV